MPGIVWHYNTTEENRENTTQIKQLQHKATSQYQLELADSDRLCSIYVKLVVQGAYFSQHVR